MPPLQIATCHPVDRIDAAVIWRHAGFRRQAARSALCACRCDACHYDEKRDENGNPLQTKPHMVFATRLIEHDLRRGATTARSFS